MKPDVRIRQKTIGSGHPLFVVAEVGVTCNYDMTIARELIDVVRDSGADAAKFIFWFPDEIMSDRTVTYSYETVGGMKSENMFEMLSKLRFTLDQWMELKAYADERGVILFSTVNSPSGIEWAEKVGLDAYKLSSWDYNYIPLWRQIARLGKPMILDTGPVSVLEVAKVVDVVREEGGSELVLVHCFHTPNYEEMNMRAIPYLRDTFGVPAGFSATDQRDDTDIMAITLGAVFVEKRLTMSRSLPGHHHALSKEPKEFAEYVKLVKNVQAAVGTFTLRPSAADLSERRKWFRHLVADRDIPKGTTLTADMIESKRPEAGVSPEYLELFVGRRTTRDLKRNEALRWSDV